MPVLNLTHMISFLQEARSYQLVKDTFPDLIFLGGAAACVQAGRLAEADPNLKILVSVSLTSFPEPSLNILFA